MITPTATLIGGFSMQISQLNGDGMFMVKAKRIVDLTAGEVTSESFEARCVKD